ncbi:unnamed protein product [Mesocestoides corti]|uniref:Adenylate kinase active site lid domain-containing protein n=1 Tax=Mesocestoides corti TaxID=53468 RepID=A0A158QSG3_MESCO|nr:unnamed protein product [Mesocestoides corti]
MWPKSLVVYISPWNLCVKMHLVNRNTGQNQQNFCLSAEPYHTLYNPPSDPSVKSRLVPAADVSDLDCRIAEFKHNFIALSQIYEDIIVKLRTDQALGDLYTQAVCHISRPPRTPAMWTPRVLLLGFSGSGRKTVAAELVKRYSLVSVHCGTLIRREVLRETKLGNAMATYANARLAVPDDMLICLLQSRLSELDCTLRGWVLYGFPRSRVQAKLLDDADLAPNRVIFLNLSHADATARLNVRLMDAVTGDHYDTCSNPPPPKLFNVPGRIGRTPDMQECDVNYKLTRHAAHQDELTEFYGQRVLNVNANKDVDTVFEQVEALLVNKMPRQLHLAGK